MPVPPPNALNAHTRSCKTRTRNAKAETHTPAAARSAQRTMPGRTNRARAPQNRKHRAAFAAAVRMQPALALTYAVRRLHCTAAPVAGQRTFAAL
jgi:hypothetical protein